MSRLLVGMRVRFTDAYLDCWNSKERSERSLRKGTIVGIEITKVTVLWDGTQEASPIWWPDVGEDELNS